MKHALLLLVVLACRERPAVPPPPDDRWWTAACGEVMPLRVGHSVTPPQLLERVEPRWPESANAVSGIVIIATVVNASGRVCDARVLKGLGGELDAAALAAVKQWRFRPALLNGAPRASVYNVSVNKRGADL